MQLCVTTTQHKILQIMQKLANKKAKSQNVAHFVNAVRQEASAGQEFIASDIVV